MSADRWTEVTTLIAEAGDSDGPSYDETSRRIGRTIVRGMWTLEATA